MQFDIANALYGPASQPPDPGLPVTRVCQLTGQNWAQMPKPKPNWVSNSPNPNPTGFQMSKTQTQLGFKA
jgi:hypothetical protein